MNEPLDLTPELAHKQRLEDLELMRKRERKHQFPISKYEIKDIMAELNLRLSQYNSQSLYSFDFKVMQTVMDFQNIVKPLQPFKPKWNIRDRMAKAKVDSKLPIAMHNGKMIYVNPDGNAFEVFTYEKPT